MTSCDLIIINTSALLNSSTIFESAPDYIEPDSPKLSPVNIDCDELQEQNSMSNWVTERREESQVFGDQSRSNQQGRGITKDDGIQIYDSKVLGSRFCDSTVQTEGQIEEQECKSTVRINECGKYGWEEINGNDDVHVSKSWDVRQGTSFGNELDIGSREHNQTMAGRGKEKRRVFTERKHAGPKPVRNQCNIENGRECEERLVFKDYQHPNGRLQLSFHPEGFTVTVLESWRGQGQGSYGQYQPTVASERTGDNGCQLLRTSSSTWSHRGGERGASSNHQSGRGPPYRNSTRNFDNHNQLQKGGVGMLATRSGHRSRSSLVAGNRQ